MSTETSVGQDKLLSIYETMSLIINAANNTDGFRKLSIAHQQLVLRFVSAHLDSLADAENDHKKDVFSGIFGEVHRNEHLRAVAFKASLQSQADVRKKLVKDNDGA
ncbi:hypothetical protein A2696_02155 [Candidatus Curtissbacteria bacterium RIFCSPHIGHO2_01_FULL_41_13]|uniref:Uncharacterized protein n=1 Tax=Candidatus Curtissbacteria bacterium RIFCSPHIGHO2_01_FULL_41_13 TaxID=1797745 RepID=A0A1F5G270_9BACT|nr:MAG: hypothetical protein A2696_02155 [Candidatus Curtissbacteria bacterium RIFCSPHIGHO2_01_FULL_41_13]